MNFLNIILISSFCILTITQIAYSASCTTDSDCNNGRCSSDKTCICTLGYVTYKNDTCNYKQKEKLTAFLLSFFIGSLGVDWFYLSNGNAGYIVAGCFKCFTGLFLIVGSCLMCCTLLCQRFDKDSLKIGGLVCTVLIGVFMVLCSLCNAIWTTVDWIRVLANAFKDGNGISLKEW
jgi:TM2 domain-containing membrane protein YozV